MMTPSKRDNKGYEKLQKEIKRLQEELEKKDEKIQQFYKQLASSSVVERWKIGKYLHDNLAQELTSAKISIILLRNELTREHLVTACDEIVNIIDESIGEVRDLSHDIIPIDVEEEGIAEAFNHLKFQTEKQHGVSCILETDEILKKINRREVATNLYNIAQEAIKNAINHGEAENIKIVLIEHDQKLYLHIKNDGKRFDPENRNSGMGIMIMKHRAEEMGGILRIKNAQESEYITCVSCILSFKSLTGD